MTSHTAAESSAPGNGTSRKSLTDCLVAGLTTEFPSTTSCEIRVAVLQAEENLWPKKDEYILMDYARDLLRRTPA